MSLRLRSAALAITLSVLAAGGLPAQAEEPAAPPIHRPGTLQDRIDLAVSEAPALDLFRNFSGILGSNLYVDPAVKGKVNLVVENVSVRTALNAVCESLGCTWELTSAKPRELVITQVEPSSGAPLHPNPKLRRVNLRLEEAVIAQVFQTAARIMEARLEIDPEVSGSITVEADNKTVEEVLDALCQDASCVWELLEGPERVLRITTVGP